MEYQSIVFDMDGVLLDFKGDDFKWKYDAVRDALSEKGVDPEDFSREELDAFIGDKGVEECVEACKSVGVDPQETWELIAKKTSEARVGKIKEGVFQLFPDAQRTVDHILKDKAELGVISNAPEIAVEATINHYDLRDHFRFFRGVTGFEDFHIKKPHPDHLKMAKAELKRSPFLYVGDAESDLLAAKNADMDAAWVRRGEDEEVEADHDYELKTLERLEDIVLGNK